MDEVTWFVPFEEDLKYDRIVMRHGDNERVYVPEKKGKWIWDKRTGTYHCSECGHDPLHEDVGELEEYKYCMNCGAEMEVDR